MSQPVNKIQHERKIEFSFERKKSLLFTLILTITVALCGCTNKGGQTSETQVPEVQSQTVSTTAEDVFNADTHTDFDEWEEYEFDDEGIVIGQAIFRATKDGVVYLVVHYAMDDPTEVYEYDETTNFVCTHVKW